MKENTRGMALLTVLVAMMIISLMLFEFQHNSMVERKLAYNELNQTQAYYLAKSGVKVGLLRLGLYGRLQKDPTVQKYIKSQPIIGNYLNMIWQVPIPPFPPEEGDTENMLKSDKDAAEAAVEQSRIENGQYSHTVSNESNKINLNFLIDQRTNKSQNVNFSNCQDLFCHVGSTLIALIDGFIRESEDPYEEFGNIRPEEIVYNIMDWVNEGGESYSGGGKDDFYQKQDPPYRAKRNRFYTVDELRLVEGINENLFRKLKPHVTVYSYDGRINVNTMSKEILRALDDNLTEYDVDRVLEYRDEQGGFLSASAFVSYVSDSIGRGSFKSKFPKPDEVFTTGGQSFIVESLGIVKKSASQVQRVVQVAAALTSVSKGGEIVAGVTTEAECKKVQGAFWDKRGSNRCIYTPTNETECGKLAGAWVQVNGKDCCQMNKQTECPTGSSGAASATAPPNILKILHWSES